MNPQIMPRGIGFNNPWHFSFKDALAIIFSGTFLYFSWHAMNSKDALAVVQTLIPLMGIILGGYFVQESAAMWFQRSQGYPYQQNYQQNYSQYGYPITQPVMQNMTDLNQVAPEPMAQEGGSQ